MSHQSAFIEPLESTFNLNALLKDEKTNKKFYYKTKEKKFEEDENALNNDYYNSESFSVNLLSVKEELKRKNIFNPVPVVSKKLESSEPNAFFGAFVNTNSSLYDLNNSNTIIKCGIPQYIVKETNLESEEKKFESDLNKYLNIYDEVEDEKMDYSRKNSFNKNHENIDLNYQLEPYNSKNYTDLFLNYSNTSQFFVKIKTVPQLLIERNSEKLNSIKFPSYKKTKYDINYLTYNLEESLLFNPFKLINYDLSLQKNFKNLIYKLQKPADPLEFYPLLIYLIQGIPSNLFVFNNVSLSFELTDLNFRFITCLHKISKNFLKFFIDFGNKMYLIGLITEYYLYNKNQSTNFYNLNNEATPFIIKKFFTQINLILIKINENILKIKNELLTNKINLIGLFNKIQNFIGIVNMIYQILNLSEAVEKYSQHNILSENNLANNNISDFLKFYEECNLNLKSHKLLDSLFNILNSFNNSKTNNYEIIKNTLLSILKSYLQFIIYLIFNSELIDQSNEYFILKNNDNVCLDKNKVPVFLQDYKNILMNNTILLNYIKRLDNDYFNVTNYKINEIIYYIEKFNFNDFSEEKNLNQNSNEIDSIELEKIHNFIEFKDKIFNKKIELMFTVNEKILNNNDLIKNDTMMKKLTHIKILKDFMSLKDEYNREKREIEIQRKKKYYEAIQNQILMRRKAIEDDIIRLKEERLEQIRRQKENESLKKEIVDKLKKKYNSIIDETKEIEKYLTGEKIKIWQNKRLNNKAMRYNLFENMFDEEKIRDVYLENYSNSNLNQNYHFSNTQIFSNINNILKENPLIENLIIPEISENLSNINISQNKSDEKLLENSNEKPQINDLEKVNQINQVSFIESNNNLFEKDDTKEFSNKFPKFFNKSSVQVDSEVSEILNKMKVIILETGADKKSCNNNLYLHKRKILEIPIQVILHEFFYDLIIKQYKIVNNCFTLMVKNKFHLKSHFEFLSHIFLCKSGDMILSFIDNCIEFKTLTLISNEEEFLYDILKNEFTKKFTQVEMIENLKYLKFSKINKFNLKYSVTNLEMAYKIDYNTPSPINFIFTQNIIRLYDSLHIYFLKIKIYQSVLTRIFSILKNHKNSKDNVFNKIFKILFKCGNILKSVHTFIFENILKKQWNQMISIIEESIDVYTIIETQISLLNKINEILGNPIMTNVNKLNLRLAKFYLRAISEDSDYFDFYSLREDESFLKNLKKMDVGCDSLKKMIIEEHVIGDFHNLKSYV
jgi:hypothetical protein